MKNALIQLNQVVKVYDSPAGQVKALKGINLSIEQGKFAVVIGRSGAGKTTLVNLLTGLDPLTSGEIWVDGVAVHRFRKGQAAGWRGKNVGVVFQAFNLIPTLTALQNVTLPMDFAHLGTVRRRRERGMELLARLDIEQHAYKRPSQVSGGQQQRIAIARSLANDPMLVVADEPTGSLDSKTAADVVSIFKELAARGKTIVMATHDHDIAAQADMVVSLFDGEIRQVVNA